MLPQENWKQDLSKHLNLNSDIHTYNVACNPPKIKIKRETQNEWKLINNEIKNVSYKDRPIFLLLLVIYIFPFL